MTVSHHTANKDGVACSPSRYRSSPRPDGDPNFMWRTWRHTKHNGFGLVMDAVLSPVLAAIFSYLFGGAMAGSTGAYIQFLLPGILILTVVPMTVYSGTTICSDITKGVHNRFRTSPFGAGLVRLHPDGWCALYNRRNRGPGHGACTGLPARGRVIQMALAIAFILFFAFGVSWIFALIGVVAKRPETVSGSSMIAIYPRCSPATFWWIRRRCRNGRVF